MNKKTGLDGIQLTDPKVIDVDFCKRQDALAFEVAHEWIKHARRTETYQPPREVCPPHWDDLDDGAIRADLLKVFDYGLVLSGELANSTQMPRMYWLTVHILWVIQIWRHFKKVEPHPLLAVTTLNLYLRGQLHVLLVDELGHEDSTPLDEPLEGWTFDQVYALLGEASDEIWGKFLAFKASHAVTLAVIFDDYPIETDLEEFIKAPAIGLSLLPVDSLERHLKRERPQS